MIVTCFHVGMPLRVRQVSEHWATEILRANEEFKVFTPLVLPHRIHDMNLKVSQNQPEKLGKCGDVP